MTLYTMLVLYSLILLSFRAYVFATNTHQFHFTGGNVAYGNVPQRVHIVGFWYIHERNPHFQDLFNKGYNQDNLRGTLYYCHENIEEKMLLINPEAEREKRKRINLLLAQTKDGAKFVTPYIHTKGCKQLPTNIYYSRPKGNQKTGRMYQRFEIMHNFTFHGPVLFVDSWGVAAFHYRVKQSEAQKLQYCENDDAAFPVIFNKRPICPRPALKSTVVEDGKLTVYKPNIESVRKIAYHCYVETTYVWTKTNFVDQSRNNKPPAIKVHPINDPNLCYTWVNTGKCNLTGVSIPHFNWIMFDHNFKSISETRWATVNKVEYWYRWNEEVEYNIANCKIDIGYIQTTPPFSNLLTPWGYVPSDYLYKGNYTRVGGEVIIWTPFDKVDICNYVPLSSFDVKRITYNSKDFLEQDPHVGATEMYHFVSDAEKSVFTSDNTQVTDVEAFNCITKEKNQTLYAINDGLIISWQIGASINDDEDMDIPVSMSQREHHAHFAYNELTKTVGNECVGLPGQNCTSVAKEDVVTTDSDLNDEHQEECADESLRRMNPNLRAFILKTDKNACRNSYVAGDHPVPNVKSNANFSSYLSKNLTLPDLNNTETTPLFSIVSYLRYKFEQYQNEEVIRRAQAWCENQQHLYDMQLMLARISPSEVISSYLNRPVSAKFIGNGVYSTHYCQSVRDFIVIDNLFVNNTDIAPRMGGKRLNEIYKAAGVPIHRDLCFTMPIIVFKDNQALDEYRVGQLHQDQTISTVNMPFLEECRFERYFLHTIENHVHVFENYRHSSTTSLKDLYDHSSRIKSNVEYLKKLENNEAITDRRKIDPLLEHTQFLDIYTKYEPKVLKPVVIGFKNTELYGYRERRRILSSFEDLIAYSSRARFDNNIFNSKIFGQKDVKSGLFDIDIDFEDIFDAVIEGGKIITDGLGDAIDFVVDRAGDTFGNVLDTTGDILSDVADFFSGGILKIVIIIAALAVCALFVYYLIKHKLLAEDDDDKHYAYQPNQSYVQPYQHTPTYSTSGEARRRIESSEKFYSEF